MKNTSLILFLLSLIFLSKTSFATSSSSTSDDEDQEKEYQQCEELSENLIKNGDFEDTPIHKSWLILNNSDDPALVWDVDWKNKRPCGKNHVDPRLEIQKAGGNQFVELDSDCQGNQQFHLSKPVKYERTKTSISQDVSLVKGSYYKLSFDLKKRNQSVKENLHVKIGKKKYKIKNEDMSLDWEQQEYIFQAGKKEIGDDVLTKIKLDPKGVKSDSFGLFVDNIKLVGLTHCKEANKKRKTCGISEIVEYNPMGVIDQDRMNPLEALGESDGEPYSPSDINFVSLGRGGDITLKFKPYIKNKDGNDLRLFETTGGDQTYDQYPEEADVYGSKNGKKWVHLGKVKNDNQNPSLGEIDLGSLKKARYIKLVDTTTHGSSDGYDLDAAQCLSQEKYEHKSKIIYYDNTDHDLYHVGIKNSKIKLKDLNMPNLNPNHMALSPNKKQVFFVDSNSPNSVYLTNLKKKDKNKLMELNLSKVTLVGMSSSGQLYVGDMNQDKIYKVNLNSLTKESLGHVYLDGKKVDLSGGDLEFTDKKMYVVTKSKGGQLFEVDLVDGKLVATLIEDKIGPASGLAIIDYNHFLISLSNKEHMLEIEQGERTEKDVTKDLCIQGSGADLASNPPMLPSKF